jgi:hypothetical protein
VAQHHVRCEARPDDVGVQRVRDRRREPRADGHRQERRVDAVALRQTEAYVGRAARRVDLSSVRSRWTSLHHLHAAYRMAPIGITSGSMTMSLLGMP